MAAAANRLTTKTTTGSRFDAAGAGLATRPSPSCLSSRHPTAIQPSAATPLCGGLFLGAGGAGGQRSRPPRRSFHPAPLVPQSGFLPTAVLTFAAHYADDQPMVQQQDRKADTRRPSIVELAHCIPISHAVLALTLVIKLQPPTILAWENGGCFPHADRGRKRSPP